MKLREIKEIIEEIECYRNEDTCILVLSQKENNALLNYINILEEKVKRVLKILKNEDGSIPDYKIIENAIEELERG